MFGEYQFTLERWNALQKTLDGFGDKFDQGVPQTA